MRLEIKHRKLWIIGCSIFFVFLVSMVLLSHHDQRLRGSAISGNRADDAFFIMTENGEYEEVTSFDWYINYALWIVTIGSAISGGLLLVVAFLVDLIIPGYQRTFSNDQSRL